MSTPYPQQPEQQPSGPYAPAQPTSQGYAAVPQGFAPGSVPVTQKVNRASIILGVVGWALIGLTVLAMWLAILNASPYIVFTAFMIVLMLFK